MNTHLKWAQYTVVLLVDTRWQHTVGSSLQIFPSRVPDGITKSHRRENASFSLSSQCHIFVIWQCGTVLHDYITLYA
jgi:hypothetical protein